MKEDIGRYLEGRHLETINLIKVLFDAAQGQGKDVSTWIDGKELVFGKGEERKTPGFMRILPQEHSVTLSFPKGALLSDPLKRLKGVPGSRMRVTLRSTTDIDPYLRRLFDAAYAAEG